MVGLKPILRNTTSFSALTLLVGSFDPQKVPDMTYNVFSGTLNPTQSINQSHARMRSTAILHAGASVGVKKCGEDNTVA